MIEIKVTAASENGPLREQVVASMAALGFTPISAQTATGATPPAPEAKAETAETSKPRGRLKKAEEPKQSIQTGDERVGPEDSAEDQAQDEEDETADKESTDKFTHEDVRDALGVYVKTYGMPAAQEDGAKVLVMLFGEGKLKVSDIPDEQDALKKAVDGIKEMTQKNPFKREPVKTEKGKAK